MQFAPIFRSFLAAASCIALFGSAATAQQNQQVPPEIQEALTEYQQVQQQINALQTAALEQNPALQAEQESLQESVEAVMVEIEPEAEQKLDRMDELQAEMTEAQQSQDQAQMRSVMMEAQQLQQELAQVQEQAMQQEPVAEQAEAFRDNLVATMIEVDPRAEELLDRRDELTETLQAAMGQQQS